MKKLTKKQALINCIDMWEWMAEHPNKNKSDYFRAKDLTARSDCWLCEYFATHKHKLQSCNNKCLVKWSGGNCSSPDSEYMKWRSYRYSVYDCAMTTKYAMAIVKLAQTALDKLK